MTSIRAVGRPAACAGFALAGLPVAEVANVREAPAVIGALADRPDIGVLLIEQDLLDSLDDPDRRALMGRSTPIVVPFPSPIWAERGAPTDDYVLQLLQRAIGYRVRLR
jgi:vacuolar-type H+-ATPase subunit F/Vma7